MNYLPDFYQYFKFHIKYILTNEQVVTISVPTTQCDSHKSPIMHTRISHTNTRNHSVLSEITSAQECSSRISVSSCPTPLASFQHQPSCKPENIIESSNHNAAASSMGCMKLHNHSMCKDSRPRCTMHT